MVPFGVFMFGVGAITLRAMPPFVFLSEEEKMGALPESRQAFEVAAARTSEPVNLISIAELVFRVRATVS